MPHWFQWIYLYICRYEDWSYETAKNICKHLRVISDHSPPKDRIPSTQNLLHTYILAGEKIPASSPGVIRSPLPQEKTWWAAVSLSIIPRIPSSRCPKTCKLPFSVDLIRQTRTRPTNFFYNVNAGRGSSHSTLMLRLQFLHKPIVSVNINSYCFKHLSLTSCTDCRRRNRTPITPGCIVDLSSLAACKQNLKLGEMRAWCAPGFASPLPHIEPVWWVKAGSPTVHTLHLQCSAGYRTLLSSVVALSLSATRARDCQAPKAFTMLFVITLVSGGI